MIDVDRMSTVIVNHGHDADGYERKERHVGLAECPGCGARIGLVDETEEWTQGRDGRRDHKSYGPAQGVCNACYLLIVDSFDGCRVYKLKGADA